MNSTTDIEFEYRGYKCLIRKFSRGGAGYVALEKDHEFFGKHDMVSDIECHGEITYTSYQKPNSIDNISSKNQYWIGFDMCHWDFDPDGKTERSGGELCTLDSLRMNTEELVDNLIDEVEQERKNKKEIVIEPIRPVPQWIQDMVDAGCTIVKEKPNILPEGTELLL